jgi:pimeloyl-ACP methyl ester carboxylesterase
VCLSTPRSFRAIGQWYDDFRQVGDDEVTRLLAASAASGEILSAQPPPGETEVDVVACNRHLAGTLVVPAGARGIVLFAHGSGSSRLSPRNRFVAGTLNGAGIATLLFDLLTDTEAADRRNVFDIELLGSRLVAATEWCREHRLPPHVGYFGASTGAAAALLAAARLGPDVRAVVSRGGRPDLAGDRLAVVRAPTLLIVGGCDSEVLELNRAAAARLVRCEHRLVVVPGATHLFEEPGTLESAAELAAEWFGAYLGSHVAMHPVNEPPPVSSAPPGSFG